VADLGLVKETDTTAELTRPGSGLGTPSFMAPEQFRNAKNASIRCDIYSLGATLYQMVTGVMPFEGSDVVQTMMRKLKNDLTVPRRLVPTLSERTDAAIRRAMSADAEKRPATCLEFVADISAPSPPENAAPPEISETAPVQPAERLAPAAPPPVPRPTKPESSPRPADLPSIKAEVLPEPSPAEPTRVDWPTIVFVLALVVFALIAWQFLL